MREETGLRINIARKLVEHIDPYAGDEIINLLYVPLTSKIQTSSELMEAKWFNLREIHRLKTIHPGLNNS